MNKPTKRQLKDKINELEADIYIAIKELPPGELSDMLKKRYYYLLFSGSARQTVLNTPFLSSFLNPHI